MKQTYQVFKTLQVQTENPFGITKGISYKLLYDLILQSQPVLPQVLLPQPLIFCRNAY